MESDPFAVSFDKPFNPREPIKLRSSGTFVQKRALRLVRLDANYLKCCSSKCVRKFWFQADVRAGLVRWRQAWATLGARTRNTALFEHIRANVPTRQRARARSYHLLQQLVCRNAFVKLAGISHGVLTRSQAAVRLGQRHWMPRKRTRHSFVQDAMHGALMCLLDSLNESTPSKRANPGRVAVPFSNRVRLFRLLEEMYASDDGCNLLVKPPKLKTFYKVMRRPDLKVVVFHRVTELGRCPYCQLCQYKMAAESPATAAEWDRAFFQHQWLNTQQRRIYAVDRARAARNFPYDELYMGVDGGTGDDMVFPHLSPLDREVPNKALHSYHTIPMKLMNSTLR